MSKSIKLRDYEVKGSDSFFFDTNVWMLLFSPLASFQQKEQEAYSRFYAQVVSRDAAVYINSIILSEFYNRNLRMDFNEWVKKSDNIGKKYKPHYVGSLAYQETVETINAAVRRIFQIAVPISDQFNSSDREKIAVEMAHRDYNDNLILEFSSKKKYKLVSNDRDVLNSSWDVEVISGLV